MRKCLKCKREAKIFIPYTQIWFCERCFKHLILKRIKKTVRKHNMFNSKILGLVFDKTPDYALCKYFLEDSKKKHMIDYKILKGKNIDDIIEKAKKAKIKTIILPINNDSEAHFIIYSLFTNSLNFKKAGADFKHKGIRFVKPIINIPKNEVETFLKLKKIKYEKKDEKECLLSKDTEQFLKTIGKTRKGLNFSIVKTIEKMKE